MKMRLVDWMTWPLRYRLGILVGVVATLGVVGLSVGGRIFLGLLPALVLLPVGLGIARRLRDVADAPLSFSLPGFLESLRSRCFMAGAIPGLAVSLFVFAQGLFFHDRHGSVEDSDLAYASLQIISGFLVGMAVTLVTVAPRFILSRLAWNILMLLSIPLVLAAVAAFSLFVEFPLVGIPACAAVCVFVWFRLGDMDRVKQGHRAVIEDALERRAQVGVKKTAAPWVERSFRGWMERQRYLTAGRYLWGGLYEAFGSLLSSWKWLVPGLFVGGLVVALTGTRGVGIMVLILSVLADRPFRLPVTSTLLLPAGRREKCRATLAVAVAASLLLVAAIVVVVGLSRAVVWSAFEAFRVNIPEWPLGTTGLVGVFLVCLLVPTLLGIHLLNQESRGGVSMAWAFLFGCFVLLISWPDSWPAALAVALFAGLLVGGWLFFLLVLRTACRRGDLG